jgi:putative transposase
MTKNLVRYQQTGDLHFVTFSCFDRRPYLASTEAKELFERSLETMRIRYEFFISAYVVMPEHVHLLVTEPRHVKLATALQALKLSVSVQQQERPFWQKRYYDFNVWTDRKIVQKRQYIHRNPVSRGLVSAPEEWKWSSFHHLWKGDIGSVEVESNWTARRRGGLGMSLGANVRTLQTHVSEARRGAMSGGSDEDHPPS